MTVNGLHAGRRARPRRGFTLIELMVVAAIIAVLLTVMAPAIKGIMQTSQLAQAENMVRAALYAARTFAVQKSVVAGVRFQDDGHMVQIYARNLSATFTPDDYTTPPIYDMKAVEGVEPAKLPGPWRVTVRDVGGCDRVRDDGGGYMGATWIGDWGGRLGWDGGVYKRPAPEWLDAEHAWFVFPVVLFNSEGGVLLAPCKFSGDPDHPWYPILTGSFAKVTDRETNRNIIYSNMRYHLPLTGQPVTYTNQTSWVGWRCVRLPGQSGVNPSQTIPVEAPTVSAALRIFNYAEFRGAYEIYKETERRGASTSDRRDAGEAALEVILSTSSDCILDAHTGLVTRGRFDMETHTN